MNFFNKKYLNAITELNENPNNLKPKEKFLLALCFKNINELSNSEVILKDILKTSKLLKPLILYHLGDIKKKQKNYSESNKYLLTLYNSNDNKYKNLEKEILFKITDNFT
ncbi:hypothetical protein KA977_10285, partial [Candidatus Dependentiae bacterium]|nr:hypothetical protein [Candidatus Dependentiae bacterium]